MEKGFYARVEYETEIRNKIIEELSKGKKYPEDKKEDFAYLIYEATDHAFVENKVSQEEPKQYKKIKDSGIEAEKALKTFLSEINNARKTLYDGPFIPWIHIHSRIREAYVHLIYYNAVEIGPYKKRMGELCKQMASEDITDEQRRTLAEKINSLLSKTPELKLKAETLGSAEDALIEAIGKQFGDATDRLEVF